MDADAAGATPAGATIAIAAASVATDVVMTLRAGDLDDRLTVASNPARPYQGSRRPGAGRPGDAVQHALPGAGCGATVPSLCSRHRRLPVRAANQQVATAPAVFPLRGPPRRPGASRRPPRWTAWWLAGAVATLTAAVAVAIATGGDERGEIEAGLTVVAGFALMLTGLAAAARASRGDERSAWWLFFAGGAVTLAAAIAWGIIGDSTSERPDAVWLDLAWLEVYPLWFAAAFLMDRGRLRRSDAGRSIADAVVLTVALALAFEQFLPESALIDGRSTIRNVFDAAYPIADLALIWFMVSPVLLGRIAMDARRALLCTGFAVWAVGDTGWMTIADFPYEPVFTAGALVLGAAGVAAAARLRSRPGREVELRRGWLVDLVPYGAAAGLVGLLVWREFTGQASKPLVAGALLVVTVLFVREVLTLRESRQRLAGAEAMALTDPLTGLGNARAFQERLTAEVGRSRRDGSRVALLMIDVDRLKLVNDTAGHAAGDRLLRAAAQAMFATARVGDVACRVGGDELAVIAPATSSAEAERIGRRIVTSIRELDVPGIPADALSVSVGVAVYPDDAHSRHELLEHADAALYSAKGAGRGRVERFSSDHAMAGDPDGALERALVRLQARESDFRTVFEAAREAMLILDEDLVVIEANAAAVRMDGRPRSALLGRRFTELVDPEALPGLAAGHAKALADGHNAGELTVRLHDGELHTIEYSSTACGPGRFLLAMRDITARRRDEEELRRRAAENRAILEALPDRIVRYDRDGRIAEIHQSPQYTEQIPAGRLIGRTIAEAGFSPEVEARLVSQRERTLRTGDVQMTEADVEGGGEIRSYETRMVPYADGEVLAFVRDVTAFRRAEVQRRESEDRYRALVETANEGIVVTGVDDTIDVVNPRFCEMAGRSADDLVGTSMYDVIHPGDRADHRMRVDQARRSLAPGRFELRLVPADGRELWIEASATPFPDEEGRFRGGVLLATDITERRRARERLQESEGRFRALADSAPMLIWMSGGDGGAVFFNRTWLDFTGRPLEDQLGFAWSRSVHPDDRGATWRALSAAWEARRPFEIEYRLRRHDGEYRWMFNAGRPRFTADGELTGYVGSTVDITERRRTQERLARLAYADDLTGLPNRARLEDFVRDAVEQRRGGEALTVLSLGLDRFKLINDGLGGVAADAVLKEVARRIDTVTPEGAIAARNFSDEFVVCAPAGAAVDAEQAALDLADALHEALRPPILAEGQELFLTMSIGVSLLPGDAPDGPALLTHADRALEECKRSTRGGTSLFRGPAPAASDVLTATSRLRRAIERDELVLHYQPVVDLPAARAEGASVEEITLGRHVVGIEALVRWQEPGGDLLPPDGFIPLAERTGLIGALGDWVAREVARQQARWQAQGFDVRVGFNLSAIQLHDPNLVDRLVAAIEGEGADPARMVIELTETAAMADLDRTGGVMNALRARGIELSIDDFGTGYSTLGRLRDLEADHIKIDGSFLAGVPEDEAAAGLMAGIVRLAEGAGHDVLAERIETQAQWDFLVACGCRFGQGFLFSPAVPAVAMTAILAQGARTPPPAAAPSGDVSRGRARRPGAPERRPHRRASS